MVNRICLAELRFFVWFPYCMQTYLCCKMKDLKGSEENVVDHSALFLLSQASAFPVCRGKHLEKTSVQAFN